MFDFREGRPTLVSQQGYQRLTTTMPRPSDGPTRLSGTKSNALHSSNYSLNHSQFQDETTGMSARGSVMDHLGSNAADGSNRSHSRAVTVAE